MMRDFFALIYFINTGLKKSCVSNKVMDSNLIQRQLQEEEEARRLDLKELKQKQYDKFSVFLSALEDMAKPDIAGWFVDDSRVTKAEDYQKWRKNLKDGVDLLKTNPNLENVTTFLLTLFPPPGESGGDDGEEKEEGELQEEKRDGTVLVPPSENPNFVFELSGYDLNGKLQEVKQRDIDYQSRVGELPFIKELKPPRQLLILIDNKSYRGDINLLINPIINKYFDNPPQPYIVRQFNQLNPNLYESLTNLIFVIGTKNELSRLNRIQIESYYNNLSNDGSLVFISTEPEAQPVFSHQCKNTQFTTDTDEPPNLRDRFIKFFAGHFFYMKRFVNDNCPLSNVSNCPSKYSPAFATFKYPSQNTDPPLRVSDIDLTTAGWVYLENDELKIGHPTHLVASRHEYLPLNVVSSIDKARHLKTILDNDWSTLLIARQEREERIQDSVIRATKAIDVKIEQENIRYSNLGVTNLGPVREREIHEFKLNSLNQQKGFILNHMLYIQKLNQKFKFLWVRGGGNCLFLSLNSMFALKGMPLLTFDLITRAAVAFLQTFIEPLPQISEEIYMFFQTTMGNPADQIIPTSKEQLYTFVFENLYYETRETYWVYIICWYLRISVSLVKVSVGSELDLQLFKPLDVKYNLNLYDLHFEEGSFPTFYVFLKFGGHYYPMFPVQTIPEKTADW